MKTYFVTVDGQEHTVAIVDSGTGHFAMTLDGATHHVDARHIDGDLVNLLIDGVSYDADVEHGRRKDDDVALPLHIKVHNAVVNCGVVDERQKALQELAGAKHVHSGRAELAAPMPGKVVKLLVEVGAVVTAGQGVVVVEAMKMENELQAPIDGKVTALRAQVGVAVESGAVLAVVEQQQT